MFESELKASAGSPMRTTPQMEHLISNTIFMETWDAPRSMAMSYMMKYYRMWRSLCPFNQDGFGMLRLYSYIFLQLQKFFSSFSIFLCDDLLNLPWFWLQYLDWSWVWHVWHITVAMIWEVCNFNGRCWKFGWLKGQNLVVCDFAFLTRHDTLMPVCQTGYMCMVRPFWYLITQTLGGLWEPR